MAKKSSKKTTKPVRPQLGEGVEILNAGSVLEDPITRTLETNYMPYAMSVIVSRALPEIDGFKPAHRKLLYTMYEMGLIKGARTKSANIVGSTMHLNPHGDAAIYDTMVRMGRGNESLLVPFVDSKGNFGKAYSRDMSCAASRYTEAKLENVCEELFRDIDKETVDFVPNYDGSTTEPTLLPVTFPTILANNTLGIAVGMACNICSFNLTELCNTTIALMKDAKHDISTTMPAPDFVGGGQILYDEAQMREIYEYGRGSVKVRARYNVVPGENMIEITQIPPTTTVEAIMDKIAELVKTGKIKEISDMRDETDLNGLKLTLDLKRGVDAEKLMAKLFKTTPLEDSFSANFNVLVSGQPRVMGVREILQEWTAFRMECVRRRTYYDLHGKEKRLHLLKGLAAILLDIDKAIHIIRTTEEETEVVPNLMIGFGIDEVQADYVAEIKLRHLNREYIRKRTGEIEQLENDIADLKDILEKPARIRKIIIKELTEVAKKYAQPRRSERCRGRNHPGLPGHRLLHPRGLPEKDPAPEPPHRRCPQAQGGRRDHPAGRDAKQRGSTLLHRQAAGVQGAPERAGRRQGGPDGHLHPRPPRHGRGREQPRHGHHRRLCGLHALLLRERQVREDPAGVLRHQAEPPQAAQGLLRQGAAGEDGLPARRNGAGHPHQRGPDAAGGHGADQRQGHPRQSGRGGRDPEKKPAHRVGGPGGDAGAVQPPSLSRPQSARHRGAGSC